MDIMGTKKRHITDPFAYALDHYMLIERKTNDEVGLAVGYINGNMISAIRLGKTNGSESRRRAIAKLFGFSLDDFIKEGSRLMALQRCIPENNNNDPPGPDPPIVLSEHQKKVEKFKDKVWGEYVNTILLEIEHLDPDAKEEITEILQAKLKTARRRIRPTPGPQEKSSGS
jgi:hypothetical protein